MGRCGTNEVRATASSSSPHVAARIRAARVLVAGVDGLMAEAAKNLLLAGVHSVTLLDHAAASPADLASSFALSAEHVGINVRHACLIAR